MSAAEYVIHSRQYTKSEFQQCKKVMAIKGRNIGKNSEIHSHSQRHKSDVINPLSLRMLQGAFIVLAVGAMTAGFVLVLEVILSHFFYGRMELRMGWSNLLRRLQWVEQQEQ